jgi:hypothetical protein
VTGSRKDTSLLKSKSSFGKLWIRNVLLYRPWWDKMNWQFNWFYTISIVLIIILVPLKHASFWSSADVKPISNDLADTVPRQCMFALSMHIHWPLWLRWIGRLGQIQMNVKHAKVSKENKGRTIPKIRKVTNLTFSAQKTQIVLPLFSLLTLACFTFIWICLNWPIPLKAETSKFIVQAFTHQVIHRWLEAKNKTRPGIPLQKINTLNAENGSSGKIRISQLPDSLARWQHGSFATQ